MKKLVVKPGCIACGMCELLVPEVFDVNTVAQVKEGVTLDNYTIAIEQAVAACPVQAIQMTKETNETAE